MCFRSTVQDYIKRHEDKEHGVDNRTSLGAKLNPLTELFSSENHMSGRSTALNTSGSRSATQSGSGSGQSETSAKSTGSQILVLMLRLRQCCSHLSLMKQVECVSLLAVSIAQTN